MPVAYKYTEQDPAEPTKTKKDNFYKLLKWLLLPAFIDPIILIPLNVSLQVKQGQQKENPRSLLLVLKFGTKLIHNWLLIYFAFFWWKDHMKHTAEASAYVIWNVLTTYTCGFTI